MVRLIDFLARRVRAGTLTQKEIEESTGVHQSQVSRILAGQAKRLSRNVQRLCKYAEQLDSITAPESSSSADLLQARILDVWDGTRNHAEALEALLRELAHVQSAVRHGS